MNNRMPLSFMKIFKQWRFTIPAAVVLALVLFFVFRGNGSKPEYRTDTVSRGEIQQTVTATGTVNAVMTVLVGTQVSGTIKKLYVDFNSKVKKGQLIAQIDPDMFEAQAEQARANLGKADAQMRDAERSLKRNQELFSRNLVPRSDLETAETNFDSAKAQFLQAKASLRLAETNLRYTAIISPVDGIVISRSVDVGQTVAASFQTPTLFTIAQDITKMQINTNVAESDIGMVKVGQDVEFSVDAYPDTVFSGKVRQIRQAPITVQNVVTYDVIIDVSNRDFKLMPGMTANVSVIITRKKDVVRIANTALRFRMMERAAGKIEGARSEAGEKKCPTVWILENGKAKRIAITAGISDGNYTEVVSGDLKEGQQLIVDMMRKNKAPASSGAGRGPRMF